MEGTVPDLFIELKESSPVVLEGSVIVLGSLKDNGNFFDPKERQKRVMKQHGLDYRVWYGEDYLELQRIYPGYEFTLTTLPNNYLYLAVSSAGR